LVILDTAYKYVTFLPSWLGSKSIVYDKKWFKSSNKKFFTSLWWGDRLGTYHILCHCWLSCWWHPTANSAFYMQILTVCSRDTHVHGTTVRMSNHCHRTHGSRNFWSNVKATSVSLLLVFDTEKHHLIKQHTFVLIRYLTARGNLSECFLRIANNSDVRLYKQTVCTQSVTLLLPLACLIFRAIHWRNMEMQFHTGMNNSFCSALIF
jgi:hypothetical protein